MSNVTVFKQLCDETGFHFHQIDGTTFMALFAGRNGRWPVFVRIRATTLSFASVCPLTVPPARRAAVLDYLNRANWQLAVGNLEMDPTDGEVSLRTSLNSAGELLTPKIVGTLLLENVIAFDHYLSGLLAVILLNTPPDEAIRALDEPGDDVEPDADDLRKLLDDLDLGDD